MGRLPVVVGNDFGGVCDWRCGRFGLECSTDGGRGRLVLCCTGWWAAWYLQCPPEGGRGLGVLLPGKGPTHHENKVFASAERIHRLWLRRLKYSNSKLKCCSGTEQPMKLAKASIGQGTEE
jgi:hypothetical protein